MDKVTILPFLISLLSLEWRSIKNLNLFAQWEKVTLKNLVPQSLYPQLPSMCVVWILWGAGVTRRLHKPRFADFSLWKARGFFYICFGAISNKDYSVHTFTFYTYRNKFTNYLLLYSTIYFLYVVVHPYMLCLLTTSALWVWIQTSLLCNHFNNLRGQSWKLKAKV